jgi:phosphoenolpyruvate synthase/pyruvate phosphate dikinase
VGPKAAKLGELFHSYPEAVVSGVAIPFGVFRKLLDQPLNKGEQTAFQWMLSQYAMLRTMKPGSKTREKATERFLERLRTFIIHAELDSEFKQQLRIAMAEMFGKDGAYGVFVRSDTNVEDLQGFTGAGLNKTVFNVVGFDNILKAISEVWASPFSKRAFAWRQAYMDHPEHVYPAVLIMRSVPVQKSGVLVTRDIDTGDPGWLSVAVNEGIGGAVDGQSAESLRINMATGKVRLLAQATAPWRRTLERTGGIKQLPISGKDTVLEPDEVAKLIQLARELSQRFPSLSDAEGNPIPADIEFGFVNGNLGLFQIRPFLENERARTDDYLASLDRQQSKTHESLVRMDAKSRGGI